MIMITNPATDVHVAALLNVRENVCVDGTMDMKSIHIRCSHTDNHGVLLACQNAVNSHKWWSLLCNVPVQSPAFFLCNCPTLPSVHISHTQFIFEFITSCVNVCHVNMMEDGASNTKLGTLSCPSNHNTTTQKCLSTETECHKGSCTAWHVACSVQALSV